MKLLAALTGAFALEKETCDALSGEAKRACVAQAKTTYKQ